MSTLNETLTQSRRNPALQPSSSPIRLFTDHAWAARLWFLVALASIAFTLIQPFLIISAFRTRERVVILDEAGTFHVSPLLQFEDATRLHTSQTLLACLALFQCNPTGFDFPDLLERLFLPEALERAKESFSKQREEFKAKQLHQKVEVARIDILETRNDLVLVQASGQLIRVGLFNAESFTESQPFTLRLTLARNPNLTANGRFPLAVWKLELP